MTDQNQPAHPDVDPERAEPANAFDKPTGYSGQGYRLEDEVAEGTKRPSGHPLAGDPATPPAAPEHADSGRDIPPDNGRRAHIDPATGEVHGSGAGAGGGNPGEDFDEGTPGST